MAYKLVQYDGRPVLKLSTGKKTLVSEKQVFRNKRDGRIIEDTIALREEKMDGEALLKPLMKGGKRLQPTEPLDTIQERFKEEFGALEEPYKVLRDPDQFPVKLGRELEALQKEVVHEVIEKELGES
jgi:nicotinate phosphoribosyltransferase